ncbi:ATP-binding protein [Pedobacter psychroterrae]|uniref:ATP-binding protein n=1 Tax=Pedobacter psychroterrae TaxID=2530453 RepID=A0A4R0NW41_9SPHI|nr:ATP-binding protein [Pedobacter psychroterrae]TCD03805.1 ATP-binding protein [Pedobacter psychroterrae]
MGYINRQAIIAQLKKDLIGKDSYRGVTLTYSWLANQFGHFSLGFIPTIIIYSFLKSKPGIQHPELWAAFGVWSAWILFETYNFLGPLLLKVPTKRTALNKGNYTFSPAWMNVAFDTLTDLIYFGMGAFAASLVCHYHPGMLAALLILLLLVAYPAYYWYTTKMYVQNAEYPFQLRLSQWNQQIDDKNKAAIQEFLDNKEQGKHMLIFGSRGSGKTTLSIGIATEASIKNNCCSYVTAVKLLSLFFEKTANPRHLDKLWYWRNCNLLVIDDINPGQPVKGDIITTRLFYDLLNNVDCGPDNIRHIRDKNIIWVMGTDDPTSLLEQKWETLLQQIGVQKSNIVTVNLD